MNLRRRHAEEQRRVVADIRARRVQDRSLEYKAAAEAVRAFRIELDGVCKEHSAGDWAASAFERAVVYEAAVRDAELLDEDARWDDVYALLETLDAARTAPR